MSGMCYANPTHVEAVTQSVEPARAILAQAVPYLEKAQSLGLAEHITWQRLLYMEGNKQSEVSYAKFFLDETGRTDAEAELKANVQALFQPAMVNESFRCRFPARSEWLIQNLDISTAQLPVALCPELEEWYGKIKPHQATLIYATDFMGNPSSMFGHTLLRIDPENQQQLNLVAYAINYAATVENAESWSYAWKGLTGQYPGEYSLMPYYRKVKEYGDFESRDLWEYELNLNPAETQFLVKHIWEMQNVTFPYYFVSDNCAYRLLGLFDLARSELNLKQRFRTASIPVETVKAVQDAKLIQHKVYRPALETQLLSQARQHGHNLAETAAQVSKLEPQQMSIYLKTLGEASKAQVLEMAYDHLYLLLNAREVKADFAQPRLRQLLVLRSQIKLDKQRAEVERPKFDPSQGHRARQLAIQTGEVQGKNFVQLSNRQAYHDLIDPQQGYRIGTQLKFLDGALQWRDEELKLESLNILSVNSYSPITPFKTPLSWGFDLGWKQEALENDGQFSEYEQHGVAYLNAQAGYSFANQARTHLCYGQMQMQLQGSQSLDEGWRLGAGPVLGCQNIWHEKLNTTVHVELPIWSDTLELNVRFNSQIQYVIDPQNALRVGFEYQQQDGKDWQQWQVGYRFFY